MRRTRSAQCVVDKRPTWHVVDPLTVYPLWRYGELTEVRLMPLKKSTSKAAFKSNIREMVKAGHPVKQAVAAAYATQRKAASKGKK